MILLALESESGAVLTFRLTKSQITVGSSSRNDVVVRSPGVAERHLVMQHSGDVFTFVTVDRQTVVLNGERRSRGVLSPGDRLRIGSMTLVFRQNGGEVVEAAPEGPTGRPAPQPPHEAAGPVVFMSDPAGFAQARARLVELFHAPQSTCLQELVALLREALPGTEVAVLVPREQGEPVALASAWAGELPRVSPPLLSKFCTPGRYALLPGEAGAAAVLPVLAPEGEVVAALAVRPAGILGNEGVGLAFEAARLLGLRWRDIGREGASGTGWEAEARKRLEVLLPGSSQAIQVLRAGMLAAAPGNEPVLVCGGEGVGRTEIARLLAKVGPAGVRHVVVVDGRGDEEALRRGLFGPDGHPTLGTHAGGAVGQARGGVLVVRNVDGTPLPVQSELAGLIAAQQRGSTAASVRWVVTCGEDPMALVQRGRIGSSLFMAFAHRLVRVPRLAERREDLPLLIAGLLRQVAAEQGKNLAGITLECLNTLLAHPFQGEMAELVGEVNRLVTATPDGEMVRCEPLTTRFPSVAGDLDETADVSEVLSSDSLKVTVPKVERLLVDRVMRRVKGNQSKGAKALAISRGALIAKVKEYGVPDYRYLRKKRGRP